MQGSYLAAAAADARGFTTTPEAKSKPNDAVIGICILQSNPPFMDNRRYQNSSNPTEGPLPVPLDSYYTTGVRFGWFYWTLG